MSEPRTNHKAESKGFAYSQYTYPKTKKINWHRGVLRWLRKIAGVIRSILHLIGEIGQHLMDLVAYLFSVVVKLATSPTAPIFFAIIAALIVTAVTINQWWAIGVWVARIAHVNRYYGGVFGTLFGIGINSFQLAPILWKIRREINDAYREMGVDTEYESEEEDTPQSLEANWFSVNHRTLKTISLLSYCLETSIVIVYTAVVQKFAMLALFQAIVSLLAPQHVLRFASHTISIMGATSRRVAYQEPPECDVDI